MTNGELNIHTSLNFEVFITLQPGALPGRGYISYNSLPKKHQYVKKQITP